jgi:ubiquinone/menaquinone biosynthesis C-methylase UbiE
MDSHIQKATARFDSWAETYGEDRISSWLKHYQWLALSRLNIGERTFFLDIGCGTGWAVREVAKRVTEGKACGVDISPKMLEKAIAQSNRMRNVHFQIADSEALPYPNESFSSVLCTCSFHHYENPLRALSEMRRVMKKDGKLVILDSARDISLPIWLQDRGRRYFEKSHIQYYTTSEMKSLILTAHLKLDQDITKIKQFLDHGKVFTGLMLIECTK